MSKRVDETLNATVDVRLSASKGCAVFQGLHPGLEVQGDLDRLLALAKHIQSRGRSTGR